jgi:hypothetical protein
MRLSVDSTLRNVCRRLRNETHAATLERRTPGDGNTSVALNGSDTDIEKDNSVISVHVFNVAVFVFAAQVCRRTLNLAANTRGLCGATGQYWLTHSRNHYKWVSKCCARRGGSRTLCRLDPPPLRNTCPLPAVTARLRKVQF